MDRLVGLLGIVLILGLAFLMSNNRKKINIRTVGVGILIQIILAVFILRTTPGQVVFSTVGKWITKVLSFADEGGKFCFGPLMDREQLSVAFDQNHSVIFFFKIVPTIIFVAVLVNIAYHLGIMQRIVSILATVMQKLMRVSGVEALSNVSSTFVGQVEAQIMIKPYLSTMTSSELMASMTGSFACIAGGVMAVYISMGIPAEYLLAASIMAAPGALAIAKIMHPETELPETSGKVRLQVAKNHVNLLDAISAGAADGLKVALNVIAMLIGFLALIALIDFILMKGGVLMGVNDLSLNKILGFMFSGFAWCMGVPASEMQQAGSLMGTKLVVNEFIAYQNLSGMKEALSPKTLTIVSFALCGFANLGSIAIQIGGIGQLVPERRGDLAKLGFKALIGGTLASYFSATIAGILISNDVPVAKILEHII